MSTESTNEESGEHLPAPGRAANAVLAAWFVFVIVGFWSPYVLPLSLTFALQDRLKAIYAVFLVIFIATGALGGFRQSEERRNGRR
jgi:hypothetical protein